MATEEQIAQARVLIPDTEAVFDGETLFTDAEISSYIALGKGSVLRGAAYAMLAIASSEAIISKQIKTQDLSTNGAQVAEALRKNADVLFKRADDEEEAADMFYLNIVDYGYPWSRPELTEFAREW